MISFVAVCRYKSNCFEYYWMLGRKSMACRWNRNRMYVHSFPGWWPSIDLSVNLLKSLILGPDFDTMRNDSPFRSACYKWLQSRFITENILQFNSIKLFHLGFVLCCQFIRIIWLGTFVSIGVALQYSDHETETILNRNLFYILCVRLPWQKTWQGSSNTKVKHSSSSNNNKRAQQQQQHNIPISSHTHRHSRIKWVELNNKFKCSCQWHNEYLSSLHAVDFEKSHSVIWNSAMIFRHSVVVVFHLLLSAMFHLDLLQFQRNVSNVFNLLKTVCRRHIFESFPPPYHWHAPCTHRENTMQFVISVCITHTRASGGGGGWESV